MIIEEALKEIENFSDKGAKTRFKRMERVLSQLSSPQKKKNYIHIAGTNGKGSTAKIVEGILIEAGYKIGLFISPHLVKINERISINNKEITDLEMEQIGGRILKICKKERVSLGFFEFLTIMALEYFAINSCDYVILEVGIGGRYDATNCIEGSLISAISSISYDHQEILGNSLEDIGSEKAGIIKPKSIAILSYQNKGIEKIFKEEVEKKSAKLVISSQEEDDFDFRLKGSFQKNNLALALAVIKEAKKCGLKISSQNIESALKKVRWRGRFDILQEKPLIILDGAHNIGGVKELISSIKEVSKNNKVIFVTGMMKDKNIEQMIKEILPLSKQIIATNIDSERAIEANELRNRIREEVKKSGANKGLITIKNKDLLVIDDIGQTIQYLLKKVSKDDVICIFGSLYLVGEYYKKTEKIKNQRIEFRKEEEK